MITKSFLLLTLHITWSVCQYMIDAGLRADMTFNEDNDRYDVGNIISEQNRVFQDNPELDEESRRSYGGAGDSKVIPLVEIIKHNRERLSKIKHNDTVAVANPRRMDDFVYHDQMLSEQEPDDNAYDRNLAQFKIDNARRSQQMRSEDLKKYITNVRRLQRRNFDNDNNNRGRLEDMVLKYLHGGKIVKKASGRKMSAADPENEILLHYAVPIRMKVKGFLEVPNPEDVSQQAPDKVSQTPQV